MKKVKKNTAFEYFALALLGKKYKIKTSKAMQLIIKTSPATIAAAAAGATKQGKTLLEAIAEDIAQQIANYNKTHR